MSFQFIKPKNSSEAEQKKSVSPKVPPLPKKSGSLPKKPSIDLPKKPNLPNKPSIPKKPVTIKPVLPTENKDEKLPESKGPLAENNVFKLNKTAKKPDLSKMDSKNDKTELTPAPKKDTEAVKEKTTTTIKEENKDISKSEDKIAPAEEPKKEKKRKNKSKKVSENVDSNESNEIIIPTSELDYESISKGITSKFMDEEWTKFEEKAKTDLNNIEISNDMGTSNLKQAISSLNELRDAVWPHYIKAKTMFENLTDKEDGLLIRIRKLHSVGSNDAERKNNAALAVMTYKIEDKNVNLYEVLDASRERYNFLKMLMDSIQYKSNAIITMLGNLKLEK